jgi:hypothetical protein
MTQLSFPFAPHETYTWYFRNGSTRVYSREDINLQ